MRHLKTYETIYNKQPKPKEGDYIIAGDYDVENVECETIIKNKVGKLLEDFPVSENSEISSVYTLTNDEFKLFKSNHVVLSHAGPSNSDPNYEVPLFGYEITHWSDSKEELEIILQSNKYNL